MENPYIKKTRNQKNSFLKAIFFLANQSYLVLFLPDLRCPKRVLGKPPTPRAFEFEGFAKWASEYGSSDFENHVWAHCSKPSNSIVPGVGPKNRTLLRDLKSGRNSPGKA